MERKFIDAVVERWRGATMGRGPNSDYANLPPFAQGTDVEMHSTNLSNIARSKVVSESPDANLKYTSTAEPTLKKLSG